MVERSVINHSLYRPTVRDNMCETKAEGASSTGGASNAAHRNGMPASAGSAHGPNAGSGNTPQAPVTCAGLSSVANANDAPKTVDEIEVASTDRPKRSRKRDYPEAGFTMERLGSTKRGSYPTSAKLKAVEFSRKPCSDGRPVGHIGAAKVLGVDKRRIIEWTKDETKLKAHVKNIKGADKHRSVNAGRTADTAEVEEKLRDWISFMREGHRGVVRRDVLIKVLQLKPNACGGLPSSSDSAAMQKFNRRFDKWYARFRKRHMLLSIRRPKVLSRTDGEVQTCRFDKMVP